MIHKRIANWIQSNPLHMARMSVLGGYLGIILSATLIVLSMMAIALDPKAYSFVQGLRRFEFYGVLFIPSLILSLTAIIMAGLSKKYSDDDEQHKSRWKRGVLLGFIIMFIMLFAQFLYFFFGIPVMLSNL